MIPNGTRVRVEITDKKAHAFGAADALNGLTGVVEETKDDYGFDRIPHMLVLLDVAPKKWWSNQIPSRHQWLPEAELKVQS